MRNVGEKVGNLLVGWSKGGEISYNFSKIFRIFLRESLSKVG